MLFSNTVIPTVPTGEMIMAPHEQEHFNFLYQQHLTNLKLQGKRPATIDAYSRAVRRISEFFNCSPDTEVTFRYLDSQTNPGLCPY